jgi:predicted RNA methylase
LVGGRVLKSDNSPFKIRALAAAAAFSSAALAWEVIEGPPFGAIMSRDDNSVVLFLCGWCRTRKKTLKICYKAGRCEFLGGTISKLTENTKPKNKKIRIITMHRIRRVNRMKEDNRRE